jgi:hypothetical protein
VYQIDATFLRFDKIHIGDLFGATGVYVIWDSYAKVKPTYIGEGHILKRLADHSRRDGRRFAKPLDGYIAVVSGSTAGVHKTESLVVERLLLDVALETDREPKVNVRPGAATVVEYLCRADRTLRVAIRGFDPLMHPRRARPLSSTKYIRAWLEDGYSYQIEHDWRWRRRQAGFV